MKPTSVPFRLLAAEIVDLIRVLTGNVWTYSGVLRKGDAMKWGADAPQFEGVLLALNEAHIRPIPFVGGRDRGSTISAANKRNGTAVGFI